MRTGLNEIFIDHQYNPTAAIDLRRKQLASYNITNLKLERLPYQSKRYSCDSYNIETNTKVYWCKCDGSLTNPTTFSQPYLFTYSSDDVTYGLKQCRNNVQELRLSVGKKTREALTPHSACFPRPTIAGLVRSDVCNNNSRFQVNSQVIARW